MVVLLFFFSNPERGGGGAVTDMDPLLLRGCLIGRKSD